MGVLTVASSLEGRRKEYPPPDISKTYKSVEPHQIPRKGYIGCLLSKIVVECGLNTLFLPEQIAAVMIFIALFLLLFGVPGYFCYRMFQGLLV